MKAVQNILEYFSVEWDKNPLINKSDAVFSFDQSEMRILTPNCPGQNDSSSCGLYLLHYIEKIFQNLEQYSTSEGYRNVACWKDDGAIDIKRFNIATLLRNISKFQGRFRNINFPDIQFMPKEKYSEDHSNATVMHDGLKYFKDYAKDKIKMQKDISLCRPYKFEVAVSPDRCKQFRNLLWNFQQSDDNKHTADLQVFKDHLKMKISKYPFKDCDIMFCLQNIEKEGLIIIHEDQILFTRSEN